jgi:hypothetical protein
MASRAQTGRAEEKRARNMQYEEVERYHPQVRFLPGKRRRNEQQAAVDAATKVGLPNDNHQERTGTVKADVVAQVPLLGYWADVEGLKFDFTSKSAKDALTAFISVNLQARRFWFERDDSEVCPISAAVRPLVNGHPAYLGLGGQHERDYAGRGLHQFKCVITLRLPSCESNKSLSLQVCRFSIIAGNALSSSLLVGVIFTTPMIKVYWLSCKPCNVAVKQSFAHRADHFV